MNRRNFLQHGLTTVTATTVIGNTLAATPSSSENTLMTPQQTFKLNYAPHDGMFANHAGKDFVEQIKFMHDQGFRGIEDNGMLKRSKEEHC
jgi:hydroxypyruvate isomerase